jgi:hypothetical protein
VIILEKHYHKAIDIWSSGVIMGDLFKYVCSDGTGKEIINGEKRKRTL